MSTTRPGGLALDGQAREAGPGGNPAGQYLWLEHATGLPISAGIAALLAMGTG